MLRQFQVTWRQPSTASYAWFLGAAGTRARLVVGVPALQVSAGQVRQQAQGHTNRPLWRPSLVRVGRLSAACGLVGWLVAAGAVVSLAQGEVRRWATVAGLAAAQLTGAPGASCRPGLVGAPASSPKFAAVLTPPYVDQVCLIFTAMGATPARHGAANCVAVSLRSGAPVRPVWGVSGFADLLPVRITGLGGPTQLDSLSRFGELCGERARITRLLVAAWRRHLGAQRGAGLQADLPGAVRAGLPETSVASWYTRPAGRGACMRAPVAPLYTHLSRTTMAQVSARPTATLRYVQAPLAWGPRTPGPTTLGGGEMQCYTRPFWRR